MGWVKTHIGICENERADSLAKSAIVGNSDIPCANVKTPLSYIKSYLNEELFCAWRQHWSSSEKGRYPYRILNKLDSNFL